MREIAIGKRVAYGLVLLVTCLAVECIGGRGRADRGSARIFVSLASLADQLPERCKVPAGDLITGCFLELTIASAKFGISFPPRRRDIHTMEVSKKDFKFFDSTHFVASDECCNALCVLTEKKCLCNTEAYSAVKSLFLFGEVFHAIYGKLSESCEIRPISIGRENSCERDPTQCYSQTDESSSTSSSNSESYSSASSSTANSSNNADNNQGEG